MVNLGSMSPKTAMARLVRSINALQDRELLRLGVDLTAQQAAIVTYLELEGAKSIREITARIGVAQSVTTRLVDRLEAKGVIVRTPHPDDGRAVRVSTTDEGSRAVATYLPMIDALKKRVFAGVEDADLEVFWNVLKMMETNVTEASEATEPLQSANAISNRV